MAREKKFTKTDLFQATRTLLLANGYEGFSFSLLAGELHISRGAIYKYYDNKEELITEYMIFEMDRFLEDLNQMQINHSFEKQFDYLLTIMYKHNKIREFLFMTSKLLNKENKKIIANRQKLREQHSYMYKRLLTLIQLGKDEKRIKPDLPDELLLSVLLQSIETIQSVKSNQKKWVAAMKEILGYGMFTDAKETKIPSV